MKDLNPVFDSFRLHDEQGIPLTVSMSLAEKIHVRINLATFACDAFIAGWSEDKTFSCIQSAAQDNGIPFDPKDFRQKMAILYTVSKAGEAKEPFKAMRDFVVDTPRRAVGP